LQNNFDKDIGLDFYKNMCYCSERNNQTLLRKRDKLEMRKTQELWTEMKMKDIIYFFVTTFSDVGDYGLFIGTCYLEMVADSTDARQTFT
jgi:hypothetical protein